MICYRNITLACLCIAALLDSRACCADEIDMRPLSLSVEIAFPSVEWTGWAPASETGIINPIRPILVTGAGDGSNRVFVPTQQGVLYVLPNDQAATKAEVFLNIEPKVAYDDKTNEEG